MKNQKDSRLTLSVDASPHESVNLSLQDIGGRIKEARKALGLTQEALAKLAGARSKGGLQENEAGKNMPGGQMIGTLAVAGINTNWLLTGKGNMLQDSPVTIEYAANHKNNGLRVHEPPRATYSTDPEDGYVAIPLYDDVFAAAGHGSVVNVEQHASTALMFREDWVKTELDAKPSDLCLISVRGNSMEPTLRASDTILIDLRTKVPDCEGIYVLRMGEVVLVKNLQLLPGAILHVSSDNPAFKSFSIKLEDVGEEVAIIGRVVWVGRKI